jgi:phosphate-selective porin OprO/OprP
VTPRHCPLRGALALLALSCAPVASAPTATGSAVQPGTNGQTQQEVAIPGIDNTIDAGEAMLEDSPRRLVKWNEYDGPHFSIRVGGGVLFDLAGYDQDAESQQQFSLNPEGKMRDARVLLKGRLKFLGETTYSVGIMYDYANKKWVFRQSGFMIPVPRLWGNIFVGRTKEGMSLNKVMVGYSGWTMERAPMNDASLPIVADGVKCLGYAPAIRLLWNFGVYGDLFSEGQTFSTYNHQIAGRVAWLPIMSSKTGTLLHIGMSERYGTPKNDSLQLRARPGAWAAPYFVDTGKFAASSTKTTGLEVYYRPGPLLFGSEFILQNVDAPASGDPFFHGGEAFVSWNITGETRAYNIRGGYFDAVSPARPVFQGGPGAWELVGHWSYVDLDSAAISGGRWWRLTAMLNWHLSDNVRLEFAYGYGSLDRFNVTGRTQFFQSRLQLTL